MKKDILKKLINKALKEERATGINEALCRCVYDSNPTPPNSGITQISGCGSCSEECCQEAGYIGLANIALDSGGRNRGVRTTTGTGPTSLKKKFKEAKRPDYPDVDGDGDRKEPMAKAFKDKKLKEAENCGEQYCGRDKNGSHTYCTSHTDDCDCCRLQVVKDLIDGKSTVGGGKQVKIRTSKTKGKKLKEAEMTVGDDNITFKIKVDVSNKQSETKLGVRIQLTPKGGMLEPDVRDKVEIAITKKLNNALEQFDMQVSKDTDVPNPEVIGFFIPLSQIKNMIVKSIKGGPAQTTGGVTPPPAAPAAAPKPATPPTGAKPPTSPAKPADDKKTTNEMIEDMINEAIISEMRVRDLKEISRVVTKEDFYAFINAGNNVLRTLEENGIQNGKKYLEYLTKHNIM